jgi:hypothetical protein
VLQASNPNELGKFLQELNGRWEKGEISDKALATLAIGLVKDSRETGISTGPVRHLGEWIYTVAELAEHALLHSLHFIPYDASRDDYRAWWKENGKKSEKEWNLGALESPDQRVRSEAVARLARMKDPALYPRLFEVLRGVEEEYAFQLAANGLAALPQDALGPAMKSYLEDRRFRVRLIIAKLLHSSMKRPAIDALIDAFERPDRLTYSPAEAWDVTRDVFEWFAEIKDDRAFEVIYRSARSSNVRLKWIAIAATWDVQGPRAESTLVEAFDEPDQELGALYGWGDFTLDGPRLCDLAGFILSIKLKAEKEFDWPASLRLRDRNLEAIRNRWRKANGLPEIQFAGPGITLVPAEKVAALTEELTHDSAEKRASGIRGLSKLGPGAWLPFQALMAESRGVTKERLEYALNQWTKTIRSVSASSDAATKYAEILNRRQHRTLDFALLREEVVRPWFNDKSQGELTVEFRRGFDGPGISIVVDVVTKNSGRAAIDHPVLRAVGWRWLDYDWARLEEALAELKEGRRVIEGEFGSRPLSSSASSKYFVPK